MQRKISDLLDDVPVDFVELNENTPLSARRIKERTMSQAGKKNTSTRRWLPRAVLIAAVIMLMSITVFAVDDIVKEIKEPKPTIEEIFGEPLADKQENVLEPSVTVGSTAGYRPIISQYEKYQKEHPDIIITIIEAVADERLMRLKLRIEAPKGTVWPETTGYGYYELGNARIETEISHSAHFNTLEPLPDSNPTDNVKEFVVTVTCGGLMKFTDGIPKKLRFETLTYHNWDGAYTSLHDPKDLKAGCCTKVLDGYFEVGFTIDNESEKLELLVDGLVLYNEEYDFTTTVTGLEITPLCVRRPFAYTTPNDADILPSGGSVEIVFKDGGSVKVGDFSEYNFGEDSEFIRISECYKATGLNLTGALVGWDFQLPEPIVLEDIDYIIYGGEHIIDVN